MGMYDNIKVKCHNCDKEAISQTKLYKNMLNIYTIGDKFEYNDCILELKGGCDCGNILKIKIKNNIIYECNENDKPTIREIQWGDVEEIEYTDYMPEEEK